MDKEQIKSLLEFNKHIYIKLDEVNKLLNETYKIANHEIYIPVYDWATETAQLMKEREFLLKDFQELKDLISWIRHHHNLFEYTYKRLIHNISMVENINIEDLDSIT